ncbi:MAG: S1 RNA-binding domain-containing protein [Chlamydiia bacterium]|nr:S1 RNA-binding domain-containing protein [Chlamydiia bacterium]
MNKTDRQSSQKAVDDMQFSWELSKTARPIKFRQEDKDELVNILKDSSVLYNSSEHNLGTDLKVGSIIGCVIVSITDKNVVVNTGLKSEGVIPIQEFAETGEIDIKVGDSLEVLIVNTEDEKGSIVLSRKMAASKRHWDTLCKAVEDSEMIIEGIPFRKTGGGFRVNLGHGIEGFLPNSQTGLSSPDEFENLYLNNECKFKAISIGSNIVLSTKETVAAHKTSKKREVLETLHVGNVIDGIVKNITPFGVFVNVENAVDGLIRLPNLSYKRIKSPAEVDIIEGKRIKVMVLSNENGLVSFGLKQLEKNPWDEIETKFPIGSKVSGKAVNIMTYGVFVEVAPGIEGLVHFSEMPTSQPISTLHEIISLGDQVDATVIYSNAKTSKLSLSMIRDSYDSIDWQKIENKYLVGSTHSAVVKSLLKHCVILELESGVTAQVHVPDISTTPCTHSSALLSMGEEVNVRILRISKSSGSDKHAPRKIVAGIRQYSIENWSNSERKEGEIVQVTISKITHFGAIAELGNGQRGYIHISEMKNGFNSSSKVSDFVAVRDTVTAIVTNIDPEQSMINLSITKAVDKNIEKSDNA